VPGPTGKQPFEKPYRHPTGLQLYRTPGSDCSTDLPVVPNSKVNEAKQHDPVATDI
jgi:hypothetical protein